MLDTSQNSIKGEELSFENGLLHLEHWDLTCIVTQEVWYIWIQIQSHWFLISERGSERKLHAQDEQYKQLRSPFLILIGTQGNRASYLPSLKLSIASGMFWSILTRCGCAFQIQTKTWFAKKSVELWHWLWIRKSNFSEWLWVDLAQWCKFSCGTGCRAQSSILKNILSYLNCNLLPFSLFMDYYRHELYLFWLNVLGEGNYWNKD